MQNDGARLNKLKEVFKRAIQEILKEEETVTSALISPQTRDSFYSDSALQLTHEDIRALFNSIKTRFGEIFKEKVRKSNLDTLLNNLDRDIKDSRVCYNDIKNEEYIKEIFESHIVDKKEEFVRFLEERLERYDSDICEMQDKIDSINREINELNSQNQESENEYQRILNEMEGICRD